MFGVLGKVFFAGCVGKSVSNLPGDQVRVVRTNLWVFRIRVLLLLPLRPVAPLLSCRGPVHFFSFSMFCPFFRFSFFFFFFQFFFVFHFSIFPLPCVFETQPWFGLHSSNFLVSHAVGLMISYECNRFVANDYAGKSIWSDIEERAIVKRVRLPSCDQGRASFTCESGYVLTLRRTDREAHCAFYKLQGVSEEQWGPPLQQEDWATLVQARFVAR